MNDQEFLKAFEAGTLNAFPHRDHIRMAWLYLRVYGPEDGTQRIREGIQQFAAAKGATDKYHETIMVFWARLVYHVLTVYPAVDDFEAFISLHPALLDAHLIDRHYSLERLWSEQARREWIEPDVMKMPSA